ncbi:MAG TPA: ABC transporter ATP-binding protein [Thermoanaerobaculia bacterium]|nr:ABC transporter ATP-binding protein [Thermoanaerobaculia bacterium]
MTRDGAAGPGDAPLLTVRSLAVDFGSNRVVDGISFDVSRGEIVALVGESGSGKTVTALSLLGLVPRPGRRTAGEVVFEGRDVAGLSPAELRRLRGGGIGFVFQEPGEALDPVRTIGSELVAVLRRHRGLSRDEARREALSWLSRVALPDPEARMRDLPHRMSGGMRQRAMIALALAGGPRLLVADEPTTALDVTIQAQLLELLRRLRGELGLAVLLVTHDLDVVAEVAGRALVLYAGEIVEEGPVSALLASPVHPYTRALLAARPTVGSGAERHSPKGIEGSAAVPGAGLPGCRFAPRCPVAVERCSRERPGLSPVAGGRAACHLVGRSGT